MHRKPPQVTEPRCDSTVLSSWPVVLKTLIENPPQSLLDKEEKDEDKEKTVDEAASSTMAVSASLMPTIWDKTIPYDGETFHLEYMDLDDFLLENGIASSPSHLGLPDALENSLLSVADLDEKEMAPAMPTPACRSVIYPTANCNDSDGDESESNSPTSDDTEAIDVLVNFEPDPTDLVLSSVPGGELFDPRKHKFSDEELKPQPMIKKAKKIYVPPEQKDDRYWTRRKKNNLAAKRSRDARRLKENQITVRAAFLEKENSALRLEVAELRKEVGRYKNIISKYEAKYGTFVPWDVE
ncbi:thyrotroph embryonic factor-like isoform X1 [Leucoraja erinacea]|uniref:thyrotroph embryonic factor-like isoform X1 n=2 Tax=Leucoraja erinaceus TaxID=7782 RepID=UPI002457EB8F|nr:thyrotroph embryonic factor-like isoform X1 [Leucoraja erinacea]